MNACAVELGLEVPGHHQAMTPQAPKYQSPGLDLDADECTALVAYVRSLPRPVERRRPDADRGAGTSHAGRATFASVGCAACHTAQGRRRRGDLQRPAAPRHGPGAGRRRLVRRLRLRRPTSRWSRGSAWPRPPAQPAPGTGRRPARAPPGSEWRTPPLWGFRDSGPYLHDGRAQTLEQAVAMHGGQGRPRPQVLQALAPGTAPGRGLPQVARRPAGGPARPARRVNRIGWGRAARTSPAGVSLRRASSGWRGTHRMRPDRSSTMRALIVSLMSQRAAALLIAQEPPPVAIDVQIRPGVLARRQADRDGRRQRRRHPARRCHGRRGPSFPRSRRPDPRAGDQSRQQDAGHRRRFQGRPPLGLRHGRATRRVEGP